MPRASTSPRCASSCALSVLELPVSRLSSLCNDASVSCAREFILAGYTLEIGASGRPATARFQARCGRKAKTLAQRVCGATTWRGVRSLSDRRRRARPRVESCPAKSSVILRPERRLSSHHTWRYRAGAGSSMGSVASQRHDDVHELGTEPRDRMHDEGRTSTARQGAAPRGSARSRERAAACGSSAPRATAPRSDFARFEHSRARVGTPRAFGTAPASPARPSGSGALTAPRTHGASAGGGGGRAGRRPSW